MQIADASAARDRFIQHRTALHLFDVLAKVADRQLFGDRDRAVVGSFLADHHPEERWSCPIRFPDRPVRPFRRDSNWNKASTKSNCLPYCLLMFEKEIILKEQVAVASSSVAWSWPILLRFSTDRNQPAMRFYTKDECEEWLGGHRPDKARSRSLKSIERTFTIQLW